MQLGDGRLALEGLTSKHARPGVVVGKTCCVSTHFHVGNHERNSLELANVLAECLAFV